MSWHELTAEIEQSFAEQCQQALEDLGALAVSFFDGGDDPLLEPLPGTTPLWQKVKLVGLFAADTVMDDIKQSLKQLFPSVMFHQQVLEEQDWTRKWLEHYHPMQFGERLWIMPFEYPNPSEIVENAVVLQLDPGLAFGTGTHPTTALCLEWLATHQFDNKLVIDYGCGSGILGIAALLLGAEKVYAVDYDPQALMATNDNATRNAIALDKIVTQLPEHPLPKASLILANILATPLIELSPKLSELCLPYGRIILSGLLTNQIESVKEAYEPWFVFEELKINEDWALLEGVRIARHPCGLSRSK